MDDPGPLLNASKGALNGCCQGLMQPAVEAPCVVREPPTELEYHYPTPLFIQGKTTHELRMWFVGTVLQSGMFDVHARNAQDM
jgi:hypothetical protein